jgi:ubiquinone/menaquinone biosynthesis C-methylase UbiE
MYNDTAGFYDRLTSDVDYQKYSDFFSAVFEKHAQKPPHSIIDLGCGTGNLTIKMAEKGFDMTGVDASAEMLAVAYSKKSPGVLWINQLFSELDLFGTYDAAISLLDCINHMLDEKSIRQYFRNLRNFIEPGGLFIFDINSEYKFKNVYSSNVFYSVDEDFSYIWQNNFNEKTGICSMDITIFIKEGGVYKRYDTGNREKAYGVAKLTGLLDECGFSVEALYGDGVLKEPAADEERIFIVNKRDS